MKINYAAISPLLFNFDACETLGVDPREMYECNTFPVKTSESSGEDDSTGDTSYAIINRCRQLYAYTNMLKGRNHGSNVNTNENETIVIVHPDTIYDTTIAIFQFMFYYNI